MGKVIGTVGVIVGAVALAATGIGAIAAPGLVGAISIGGIKASTLLLAGTALQAAGRALTKQPKASSTTTDRLTANLVTDTPRKMAFGRTALNTDLRYQEWWGNEQEYCSQVFALASHHCESIDEIWLDDKLAWTAAGGVQGEFAGYLVVAHFAQAGTGSIYRAGWSNRWGGNATFSGCATLYLQFKVTGNGKKGKSPFTTSITNRVTIVGKGARLPDPRFDSTVGGAGSLRVADQSTWAWAPAGHEAGRNPALALLFYLIGWRIQNPVSGEWRLAVGRGVPVDRIDLDSFMTAANLCDELVTKAGGGTEPRYRCDGTFSEGDDPSQVIAAFETCMNAKLRDSGGRFALQVLHNDLGTPVVDFTDDDVLGEFTWTAGNDLNDQRNVVRGRYTNPSALYQLTDFPAVRLAPVDGIDRIDAIDLALVQSPSQAQRLAKQRLQRQQYQGAFGAQFNARGWAVKDGDIVRLTFSALGWDKKLFRVSEGLIDPTGVVPLVLVEENAQIYAWDRDEAASVQAAEPNTFNPLLLPLITAIDEAGETADWPSITGEGKPDDYATVGAPIGTNVGDRPVADVIQQIDKARADIDGLIETVSEGQTDLSQQVDAANNARDAAQTARDQSQAARDAAQSASTLSGAARDAAQTAKTAAEGAAATAAQKATDAGGYASTAIGQATIATQKADAAGQSATNASASAFTASTKAGEASTSAQTAVTAKNDAQGSATSAGSSANVATQAKTDAQTAAKASSDSANSASTSSSAAGQSATSAAGSATAAGTSAGQASTSAGQASSSAADALGSKNSAATSASVAATTRQAQQDDYARTQPSTFAPGDRDAYAFPLNVTITGSPDTSWPQPYITQTPTGQGAAIEDYLRFKKLVKRISGRRYRVTTYVYVYCTNMRFGLGLYGNTTENWNDGDTSFIGWMAGPIKPANAVGVGSGWIKLEGEFSTDLTVAAFYSPRLVILPDSAGVPNNGVFHTTGIVITDITSERAASDFAAASSTSASSAAASQTAAGQSASAAEGFRQAASTAAGTAVAARDTAVTAKNDAQGAANSAASSSTLAAGASSAAIAAAAADLPSDFTQNGQFWMTSYEGTWEASRPEASGWTFPVINTKIARSPAWLGGDGSVHPSRQFTTRGRVPLIAGRKYRFTFDAGLATYQGGEVSFDAYFLGTAADMVTHVLGLGFHEVIPAPYVRFKWVFECTADELLSRAPSAAYISPFIRGRGGDGMVLDIYVFKFEDITSESAAQGYASSASGSASSASASAGAAGNSATAAEQSRINANAANGAAQTAAGAANSSAVAADASRAQAQIQATIASSYGSTSANANDKFANWPDPAATPAGWSTWAAEGNYRTVRLDGGMGSPYAIQTLNDIANVESGFMQVVNGSVGPWVMEATVRLDANSLLGSGLTVHGQWNIDFAREADTNGVVSYNGDASLYMVRTFSKLFYMTPEFIRSTSGRVNFHCMHSWSAFGQRDPRYMSWFMARLRPATQPEVDAGKALGNAATNAARIEAVNKTLADQYGVLAQRVSTTEATAGNLVSRTGINESAVADLRTKQAAARLELTAASPGGNAKMTLRSDSLNGNAIDFGADNINFVGRLAIGLEGSGQRLKLTNKLIEFVDGNGDWTVQLGDWS